MAGVRADKLLHLKGLASSRALAQKLITAGAVSVRCAGTWQSVNKPSEMLDEQSELQVQANDMQKYVSRAGLKLESALNWLKRDKQYSFKDKVALDVGQSTGGFTDCLLQFGVARVLGVDVGRDQLAAQLKKDPRVTTLEGINARALPKAVLSTYSASGFDLCVMDVSFISQTKILPGLVPFLAENGILITLVKPQFECGPDALGKNGVVKSAEQRFRAVQNVEQYLSSLDLVILQRLPSPIAGGDGNQEFLVVASVCADY